MTLCGVYLNLVHDMMGGTICTNVQTVRGISSSMF